MPWWQDLVSGHRKNRLSRRDTSPCRETPWIRGWKLNDAVVKGASAISRLFRTYAFFTIRKLWLRSISGKPWPHYDEEGKWCNCVTYQ